MSKLREEEVGEEKERERARVYMRQRDRRDKESKIRFQEVTHVGKDELAYFVYLFKC
jgi:hypothetical protein